MKKIFTILGIAAMSTLSFAQTPVNVNGSLETWPDATVAPTGWFINASLLTSGSVFKATQASDGVNSLGIKAPETSYNGPGLADVTVVGNSAYTLYYDVLDNSTSARVRPWGQWRDASSFLTVTNDPFQSNDTYSTENAAYQRVRLVSTSPAAATILRLTFRVYPQDGASGGSVYIDNVMVFQGNVTLSTSEAALHKNALLNTVWGDTAKFKADNAAVEVYNTSGQLVKSFAVKGTKDVDVSTLAVGAYIVKVTINGKTSVAKAIKK